MILMPEYDFYSLRGNDLYSLFVILKQQRWAALFVLGMRFALVRYHFFTCAFALVRYHFQFVSALCAIPL
jgi:hypothetical protein